MFPTDPYNQSRYKALGQEFKNTVWSSMEEGAEILIQEQENPTEILDGQEQEAQQDSQVQEQDQSWLVGIFLHGYTWAR